MNRRLLLLSAAVAVSVGLAATPVVRADDQCLDTDKDSVCDVDDNCPLVNNLSQLDTDGDGKGNACDNCPFKPNPDQKDSDNDGFGDACDEVKKAEGCTPGYWKQEHHFDSWTGYAPGDSFESVFGRDVPGDPTLLEALEAGGGGLTALMRHTVAALLNAASGDVDPAEAFDTTAEVVSAFQEAFDSGDYATTKNLFETSNESGCPLN
jgi:hypothetical protein